ncbi:hypothetical protein A3H80_04340 [Candidatus Roizmanbacteria bacterium RIFCSPLOWO2_02_FULL_37_19]|uniref:Glycosyl transferase n=1 Tax=Candidatus Roizmanbacteria bacterium RIFCSPHIGHO2_02_FULL_37_24 TaxID=1802037 RepID=A0A1F7GVS9_9BACT|nr:MAG: hypothetical protein A2862_03970 [Candidatus Roizmanbacteria bacterium RIFCSPHIGHO2_01_FULL_38_41]OGK23119.1 MAG: hypothetical protein A3C24_01370 [Candidatus Roizmanbacteria bacterium RIFCSPHIGHO2_02_FULL_37_24]OGK32842.1 MAG: hypothetical protein A3E10_00030 [Candidatus Roizmanbacteria bacterium RIFCSPHIGHO2_12_FULL_37_23]OGK45481.1 MAG: hypothetical protein A2956_00130 [Candidatus Roizmanbacteria bacterium RIFCSPLOWO2_01_FULL_37_57]OGK54255.1 MAG: hypothetical protein A3H80_04340 [Ca
MSNKLLEIELPNYSKRYILEESLKYIKKPKGFFHIISLNPEIFVITHERSDFKKVVKWGRIRIVDGKGVVITARMLGYTLGEHIAGVELMQAYLKLANVERLRVMLIGGKAKIAEKVVDCQKPFYPEADLFGIEGIKDIKDPKKTEEERIFSIITDRKPHFIFVAFGSPEQELWLYKHRKKFEASICMGVGGAFDFLSGNVPRAPKMMRIFGLEWLFRLIIQPWRWRRQLRLFKFVFLILQQRFQRT